MKKQSSYRLTALGLGMAFAAAFVTGASRAETPSLPACITYWPEVRYRNYGYDHIVHLANGCPAQAICSVSTDVNPNPIQVTVPSHEEIEVLSVRGSPAREFTPRVECGLVLSQP
jgi:hypothetical protein